jgi:4-hydroxybenzoate polyprenyltransferase
VYVDTDDNVPWYHTFAASVHTAGERAKVVAMHSTAYLVVIATIESILVTAALSVPPNVTPLVVGLLTFAVYGGDRIADADTDEMTSPDQSAFVRRYESVLSVLTAGAYGVAIAISITGGPLALGLTLLPGAFWILYASDWLPTLSSGFDRLKGVLVVNSALVALAWAITMTFLPLAFADAAFSPVAAVVFAYFFLDRFINVEIPNVEDRAGDEAIGVSTLPTVLGLRRTRRVLYGLTLAVAALLIGAFVVELLTLRLTVALLVGVGYTLVASALVGRLEEYGRLTVASNGKHLAVFAAVLLLSAVGL